MGIISRAETVLASNFNALIARFEEPGRDLRHLLGEMNEQIHAAQRELIRVLGEKKRNEAELGELEQQIEKWQRRAELAVQKGDDALAREALAQKQRVVVQRDGLTQTRSEAQRASLAMKAEIDRMIQVHRDFCARQGTIATQLSQSRAGGGATGLGAKPGSSSFDAFDRIEGAINSEEAEVSAQAEVDQLLNKTALGTMSNAELDQRFATLEQSEAQRAGAVSDGSNGDAEGQPGKRVRIEP
jgi:phage shock protein A